MKHRLILLLLLSFITYNSFGQTSLSKNQLLQLSQMMLAREKLSNATDAELKALVARQCYAFYNQSLVDDQNAYALSYDMMYYGYLSISAQRRLNDSPLLGLENARAYVDSSFNQFHGHESGNKLEKQVAVRSIDISPDGKMMYSAGGDGRLLAWDPDKRDFKEVYKNDFVDRVINVSPNNQWLALATNRDEIDLFDMTNPNSKPKRIKSHKGAIYDLVFLPDNSAFISVGADREILKTEIKSTLVSKVALITSQTVSLAISPDGKTLATGSTRGEVYLYDLTKPSDPETQWAIVRNEQDKKPVRDVAFSSDGKFLAIAGFYFENGFGYVTIWDMEKKEQLGLELGGFSSRVSNVEFSPDGKLVAAASSDKTVRIWNLEKINDIPLILNDANDWIWDIAFDPDGKYLMTASAEGIIRKFPLSLSAQSNEICDKVVRNLSEKEWSFYFGPDMPYQETCPGKPIPVE